MLTSTVHAHRQNRFKISTRDAHLHLSTLYVHLHLSALDKISNPSDSTPEKNSGPDTWPPIRFHQGKARAQTQIPPREKLGPRCLGLIPPRRTLGPSYSGPRSAREKTRAQVLGAKQIPWVPISRVPARAHDLALQSPPLSVIGLGSSCYSCLFLCAAIGSVSPR